jgi:hypothetical protein
LRGRAEQAEQQADAYRAELECLRAATVDVDLAEGAPHAVRRAARPAEGNSVKRPGTGQVMR